MSFVLIWIVAVMTVSGPVAIHSKEKTSFSGQAACEAYAKAHTGRMADYARGILHLDWTDDVLVTHRCVPAGQIL